MDDLLLCPICLENYNISIKIPLSLICGHTFCRECLLLINKKGLGIICPNDKNKDLRNINSIPKNFSLLSIIELMASQAKSNVPISLILSDKNKIVEQCKQSIAELEQLQVVSAEEECRSLAELEKGFNIIREVLSYRESELIQNIRNTHESISERIKTLLSCLNSTIAEHTNDITSLNELKLVSGDSSLVDSKQYSEKSLSISDLEAIKTIVSKLPVQILISPSQFENCIQSFAKVIDDTQSRVSGLNAIFVADIRVQDGEKFMPSSTFVKT